MQAERASSTPLFREEAMRPAATSTHGDVLPARQPGWALIAGIYGAVAAAAAVWLAAARIWP